MATRMTEAERLVTENSLSAANHAAPQPKPQRRLLKLLLIATIECEY
jgi:hypothetical protein